MPRNSVLLRELTDNTDAAVRECYWFMPERGDRETEERS